MTKESRCVLIGVSALVLHRRFEESEMYAQAAIKPNILLRNGAYGIVMRGVQKCTCAGASLRSRNSAPLCCIKLDTATDGACGTGGMLTVGEEHIKKLAGTQGKKSPMLSPDRLMSEMRLFLNMIIQRKANLMMN